MATDDPSRTEEIPPRERGKTTAGFGSEAEAERRARICDNFNCEAEAGARGNTNCVNCGAELIEKDGAWYHWSQFDAETLGEPQDYVQQETTTGRAQEED